MKLKGTYSDLTTYDVGDVVIFTEDDNVYHLQQPCAAGTKPKDTRFWSKTDERTAETIRFIRDAFDEMKAEIEEEIPKNISDDAITLSTETADYLITVDDSGETPELEVTAIEEEEGD